MNYVRSLIIIILLCHLLNYNIPTNLIDIPQINSIPYIIIIICS